MGGSLRSKLKSDICGRVALVASLVVVIFFFVYFYFDGREFVWGAYSPVDFGIFGRALEQLSSGDTEDVLAVFIALPLYLLRGLALIAIGISPPLMLALSVVIDEESRKRSFIVGALVVDAIGYPSSQILYGIFDGFGSFDFSLPVFGIYILTLVVFLVCILALPDKKHAAPIACAALCCTALVMTFAGIGPFSYDYAGTKFINIDSLLWHAAFWVAVAFAIMSARQPVTTSLRENRSSVSTWVAKGDSNEAAAYLSMSEASKALKELKGLKEIGAITQSEYDAKKKELLGL